MPLSCVPPSSSPVGFAGLNDSDWNWIVFSPSFSGVIAVGIPLVLGAGAAVWAARRRAA